MGTAEENAYLSINQSDVSEKCRHALMRTGFTNVGEIAEFIRSSRESGVVGYIKWITFIEEIVAQLKILELWPYEDL